MTNPPQPLHRPPGVTLPWDQKKKDLPPIVGDEKIVKQVWENVDALTYMYIWQVLVSF
jgi:hypothetical protein